MAIWTKTNLSVKPPSYQLADTDRVAFQFPAGEAIASVTAQLEILPDLTSADGLIESATVNGTDDGAVVIVAGLTRGITYELAVTFVRADDTTWTRTLNLECVA